MKYNTLEEVQQRKDELSDKIQKQTDEIGELWNALLEPKTAKTKGEFIANVISNAITAFDAFMLVRKLTNQYSDFFSIRSKKKKRK